MKGVLIDANLLCVLVVGSSDPSAIARHPRLQAFTDEDYRKLVTIIERFDQIVFCPHVLTETSNLLPFRQSLETAKRLYTTLAALIDAYPEQSAAASIVVADPLYLHLGLTDAILVRLASDTGNTLLSVDGMLCRATEERGLRAINYNYVRDGALPLEEIHP